MTTLPLPKLVKDLERSFSQLRSQLRWGNEKQWITIENCTKFTLKSVDEENCTKFYDDEPWIVMKSCRIHWQRRQMEYTP